MVNFLCQPDWAKACKYNLENIISRFVFEGILEEISI